MNCLGWTYSLKWYGVKVIIGDAGPDSRVSNKVVIDHKIIAVMSI